MTNQAIIEAVQRYQRNPFIHPLTCGVDSCRADLRAVERDGRVVLACPICGQVQEWIPEYVFCVGGSCHE